MTRTNPEWIYWGGEERAARKVMRAAIGDYLHFARRVHSFLDAAVFAVSSSNRQPLSHAGAVQLRILAHASHTLRVAELACINGYAHQAAGLMATLYEACAAVAFIGDDNAKAQAWESHSDKRQSYPSVKDRPSAIRALLSRGGRKGQTIGDAVREQEALYGAFCMAKHGNPILLRPFDKRHGATFILTHGPSTLSWDILLAKGVLYHGASYLLTATRAFATPRLPNQPARYVRHYLPRLKLALASVKLIDRALGHAA